MKGFTEIKKYQRDNFTAQNKMKTELINAYPASSHELCRKSTNPPKP